MQEKEEIQVKPQYLHIYPFRFVQPYPHTYRTFTKGRWRDKPLLPTLIKQFKAFPPEYYQHSIQSGAITINGNKVNNDYILRNGDQIIHTSIRVEPPILDLPIEIVQNTDDFVIVNKPASVIVHTGGGNHFNTVDSLLRYEFGFANLHVLHRLDKCTSGLLIFAKNKEKVALFHEESGNEKMKKMYFARVNGKVEWEQKDLSAYIQCISHKDGVYKVIGEIQAKLEHNDIQNQINNQQNPKIQKKQQIEPKKQEHKRQKQNKMGDIKDNRQIKDSRTLFKRVWYDERSDSSLLQCYPITGRTHQIRVHLQYLGHPILNDVVYGGRFIGNPIIDTIDKRWNEEEEEIQGKQTSKKIKPNEQLNVQAWDYQTKPWEIMLHSYRYKFGGKQFTTKLPYWHKIQTICSSNDKQQDKPLK